MMNCCLTATEAMCKEDFQDKQTVWQKSSLKQISLSVYTDKAVSDMKQ